LGDDHWGPGQGEERIAKRERMIKKAQMADELMI
jgi:hypothetical protein